MDPNVFRNSCTCFGERVQDGIPKTLQARLIPPKPLGSGKSTLILPLVEKSPGIFDPGLMNKGNVRSANLLVSEHPADPGLIEARDLRASNSSQDTPVRCTWL